MKGKNCEKYGGQIRVHSKGKNVIFGVEKKDSKETKRKNKKT